MNAAVICKIQWTDIAVCSPDWSSIIIIAWHVFIFLLFIAFRLLRLSTATIKQFCIISMRKFTYSKIITLTIRRLLKWAFSSVDKYKV